MARQRALCTKNSSLIDNGGHSAKSRGAGVEMKVSARLKVDFSDPVSDKAIQLVRKAGCMLTTIPVSAQPFPELLVNGRYYRGWSEIQGAVAEIKRTQD